MLKERDAIIRKAAIALDALVVTGVFILSVEVRRHFRSFYKLDLIPSLKVIPRFSPSLSDYIVILFLVVTLWCIMLYINGMYRSMRAMTLLEMVWIIIKSMFMVTVAFGVLVFLLKLEFVSRLFFTIFLITSAGAIAIEKIAVFTLVRYVRRQGYNYRRLLVVGTGRRAINFIDKVNNHPEWGFRLLGVIDYEKNSVGAKIKDFEVIGDLDDLPHLLKRLSIDEVVFIVPRLKLNNIENALYTCETLGVRSTVAMDIFDFKIAKARQTELDNIPFITFETTSLKEGQLFIKRALDVIVSGLGIAVLSPIFLIVALLIKLTSPGPIFFLQKRLGLNGRKFVLFKFRTMYKGAQKELRKLLIRNEMAGPVFKIKDDPRITPLGKFLRKFSIDELPQLFNVFLGQMSLVGPRPPVPKEVLRYQPWQRRRLSMRPGITCFWQIAGRNKISDFNEWMRLDLAYIDSWSLWLDFKIFFKTIPVVLASSGAY